MQLAIILQNIAFLICVAYIAVLVRRKYGTIDFSHFVKRASVMNRTEYALYLNLVKELGGEYIVLSKVRIEDFVEVKAQGFDWRSWNSLRSRIKSRHVDFLICDRENSRPLLAIELDGLSHLSSDRIIRDHFIDTLYKNIGLPINHIHVGSDFVTESKIIKESVKNIR